MHGVDEVQPAAGSPRRRVASCRGRARQPAATTRGEGYVTVRDPQTEVVRDALHRIVSGIRVELMEAL